MTRRCLKIPKLKFGHFFLRYDDSADFIVITYGP